MPVDKIEKKEEIKNNNTTGEIKFCKKYKKDFFTYEVYEAKTKKDAMNFLNGKIVTEKLYYICVDTPEGNFGRDINGIYEE